MIQFQTNQKDLPLTESTGLQVPDMIMAKKTVTKNWVIGNCSTSLQQIHQKDMNIAIYNREIDFLSKEIAQLLATKIELRASGNTENILSSIKEELLNQNALLLLKDIEQQLLLFSQLTKATSFRLLLATVNTNMCRKFHTDINDLRLLCTYSGPGTLWLTEDNVNRNALDTCRDNECIVLDENKVQQAPTGAIVILKGAIYPQDGTAAVVHRSPTIEESGQKRLLLRIDTNEFLNFD